MANSGPRPLVAGNWKMNGTTAILKEPRLLASMLRDVKLKCEVLVCPPATLIRRVKSVMKGSRIKVGGQDCHWHVSGALGRLRNRCARCGGAHGQGRRE